jgi:hypothetical protein
MYFSLKSNSRVYDEAFAKRFNFCGINYASCYDSVTKCWSSEMRFVGTGVGEGCSFALYYLIKAKYHSFAQGEQDWCLWCTNKSKSQTPQSPFAMCKLN